MDGICLRARQGPAQQHFGISYWEFVRQYLTDRFGENGYCLSAESSLDVIAAQNIISQQLVVLTKTSSNQLITLPHGRMALN